jgi:RHS repeat-associated protein
MAYDGGNISRKSDVCGALGACYNYGENGAGPHQLTSITTSASITQRAVGSVGFAYGDEHQRYKMCSLDCTNPASTTYYLYDPVTGGMSEKVVAGANTTWNDYIVADGQIVAVRVNANSAISWNYVVGDHLASPTTVTTCGSSCTTEHDSYDAWGKRRSPNASDDPSCTLASVLTRGFTQHEMLDSFCLVNMNGRVYDPGLGLFISADSVVPNPYDFTGFQRYSYTGNNPLNAIDPSGHSETDDSTHYYSTDGLSCLGGCWGTGLTNDAEGNLESMEAYAFANSNQFTFTVNGKSQSCTANCQQALEWALSQQPDASHVQYQFPQIGVQLTDSIIYPGVSGPPGTVSDTMESVTVNGGSVVWNASRVGTNAGSFFQGTSLLPHDNGDCALYGCADIRGNGSHGTFDPSIGVTAMVFPFIGGDLEIGHGWSFVGGGLTAGESGKVGLSGTIAMKELDWGQAPSGLVFAIDLTGGTGVFGGNATLYANFHGGTISFGYSPAVGASGFAGAGYLRRGP